MGDLLISGSGPFVKYNTQRTKEKFKAAIYEENEATYMGMEILKVGNNDFEGVVSDPNGYEGKINHIGISHE